ncbi:MAG: DnaK suppressor protein [Sphingobacteriales bacterium]|jgi:DnaK suppressor protein
MAEKTSYSKEELKEFEELINAKLKSAVDELTKLQDSLRSKYSHGTDDTTGKYATLEDSSDTLEKEQMNQLASRQKKFIDNLQNALARINNGTYGQCIVTGKLISKERLRLVPHTTMSMEAKLRQQGNN